MEIFIFFYGDPAAASAAATVLDVDVRGKREGDVEDTPALPSLDVMPPKNGERRCGAVENKGSRLLKTPREVTLQLQANMVVLCAKQLLVAATESPNNAEKLSCVSCYGAQFGTTIPIKLLKLEIDFSEQKVKLEELFVLPMCPESGAYIGYCPILHIECPKA